MQLPIQYAVREKYRFHEDSLAEEHGEAFLTGVSSPTEDVALMEIEPIAALTILDQRANGDLVVRLRGVLDDSTVEIFRQQSQVLCEDSHASLVIDMTEVTFVDSDGLGALIYLQKQLTGKRRSFALVGCQESVRSVLRLTRLEVLLPCFSTLEEFRKSQTGNRSFSQTR